MIREWSLKSKIFWRSLNELRSRLSKVPWMIFDLEEFSKIFKLSLSSKIFEILEYSSIMKNVGSSLNDLWSRRSPDDLRMKFDLEYFPKIPEWPSISKIFRRSLNVFWYQRSSDVSPNFIKLFFFQIICTFLLSQSKSECLRISSKYIFFKIICTFLLFQSKVSVSEFHQIIFFSKFYAHFF